MKTTLNIEIDQLKNLNKKLAFGFYVVLFPILAIAFFELYFGNPKLGGYMHLWAVALMILKEIKT